MNALLIIIALILTIPFSFSSDSVIYSQTSGSYSGYEEIGIASWYGPGFHGRKTANGERFNTNDLTAAHKNLPFNTLLKVINLENGRYTIVRVNDRGPYVRGRIIDLSYAAKNDIGMGGTTRVKIEIYEPSEESEISDESNNTLTLFDDAISVTSKILIESKEKIIPNKSQQFDLFRGILSNLNKVKVVIDKDNSVERGFNLFSEASDKSSVFMDISNKINIFTGYSIYIDEFSDEKEARNLMGKLESLKFENIYLVEIISNDTAYFKVFVGYYENIDYAEDDLNTLKNLNFSAKTMKVLN